MQCASIGEMFSTFQTVIIIRCMYTKVWLSSD